MCELREAEASSLRKVECVNFFDYSTEMCRLMAFIGSPTLLADVVLWPDRSIIKQSYDARERLKDPSLPFREFLAQRQ